ncbi:hypothetical protein HRE60_02600 [Streptococcus salivarius]|uniref:YokE-like PH domain-containing protein n=1 Tax=Streptococcus salivarius TaxID=1304 RepID=A0A7L6WIT5_STRSL|nr:hypothetical protein [Streptococcus salivarius]QMI50576.1 hypothetical protein HRE60_02600 [Streptococcus salivarius]
MGFKYEAIKSYLIDHGVDPSLAESMHAIYATQRLGGTANAYFLIVFTEKEVYIISITPLGKLGKIIATLPEEMIRSYQFKKRFFIGYKLRFVLTDGRELDFNINKMMIGAGWHKTELQSILETNYYNKNIK